MNKLIDYVLHNLWGLVKKIIKKYNLGYMVLPLIYLTITLLVVPNPNKIVDLISIKQMDSYTEVNITKEDKINTILDKYNLTFTEFNILSAIVISEAEYNSYDDAYAVINTIYNRTISDKWIKSVDNKFGVGKGQSLYYQAISPNQFTVYQNGTYKKNLNCSSCIGYDAVIDFLYTLKIMHNYLSFRSHDINVSGSETFSEKGNYYFNEI